MKDPTSSRRLFFDKFEFPTLMSLGYSRLSYIRNLNPTLKFHCVCFKPDRFVSLAIFNTVGDLKSLSRSVCPYSAVLWVKVKNDHRSKFSNLNNWKEEAWKNQGFNGIRTRALRDTGAILYQLSYEATHWERGQFIEFISPVRSEMMWGIYEIIHIWTAVVDQSEEWSSQ